MHREILLGREIHIARFLLLNRNIPCADLINLFEVRHAFF